MLEDCLVQIAGVVDEAEASMLQQCDVKYIGFPLRYSFEVLFARTLESK